MSLSFLDEDRFLISGGKDDYRAFLTRDTRHSLDTALKRLAVRMRHVAQGTWRVLRRMIAAAQEAKMRQIERELQMRGIRYAWHAEDEAHIRRAK